MGRQGEGASVAASPSRPVAASPSRPLVLTPLIVNHEIVSLPSASALAIQRAELAGRKPAPKMLAVIADPVFDRKDVRFKTAATEASDKEQAQAIGFDSQRTIEHLAENSNDKAGTTMGRAIGHPAPAFHPSGSDATAGSRAKDIELSGDGFPSQS